MSSHKTMRKAYQQARAADGFTLVELMISIVLGLLLVAAAVQLFTGGLVMARLQQGSAQTQDNGLFGLDYVVQHVRLTNFENVTNPVLTDNTLWGGLVFTAKTAASTASSLENLPANLTNASSYIPSGLLSHSVAANEPVSAVTNEWQGLSNVAQKSDQLTIQFVAPGPMTNCEGAAVQANDLVIERYFLRVNGAATGAANIANLALACDANTPTPATAPTPSNPTPASTAQPRPAIVNGLGGPGQVLIPGVDHFHVLLIARQPSGNLTYYTINQYKAAALAARSATPVALEPPRLMGIKMAVLVRSEDSSGPSSINPGKSFVMFDQTVTPNSPTDLKKNRFVRQVYSTTVAFRNGFGEAL
jgi:type IV pilus assembly protein PilW